MKGRETAALLHSKGKKWQKRAGRDTVGREEEPEPGDAGSQRVEERS